MGFIDTRGYTGGTRRPGAIGFPEGRKNPGHPIILRFFGLEKSYKL